MRPVTVDALIVKNNSVLLVKRKFNPCSGLWALPGGYLDDNETVEDAVLRETKEETGIDAKIVSLFGVYSDPEREKSRPVTIVFLLVPLTDDVSAGDDAEEAKLFHFDDIPEGLAFDHGKIIGDFWVLKNDIFNNK